jgi:hypothetical protein
MEMTLRFEIFPSDLDEVVDFYTRVLRFGVTKDQRHEPSAQVSMRRGAVQVGAPEGPLTPFRMPAQPACLRPEWNWCLKWTTSPASTIWSWRPGGRWSAISRIVIGADGLTDH